MEPPNRYLVQWRFGPMCTTCKYLQMREGKYWCTKYDLNVGRSDIRDDYEWDKGIRVT